MVRWWLVFEGWQVSIPAVTCHFRGFNMFIIPQTIILYQQKGSCAHLQRILGPCHENIRFGHTYIYVYVCNIRINTYAFFRNIRFGTSLTVSYTQVVHLAVGWPCAAPVQLCMCSRMTGQLCTSCAGLHVTVSHDLGLLA